jgi:cyclase
MRINAGIFLDNFLSYTTLNFERNLYLGCPINATIHFDRFQYDEILIIENKEYLNSFDVLNLKKISESSMKPKCYGGGIKSIGQAKAVIEIGFERISLRNLFFIDLDEYRKIILLLGKQSVTLCLDIKKYGEQFFIIVNGKEIISLNDFEILKSDIPGEIFINYIDFNGTLLGVDLKLAEIIRSKNWNTNLNYCGGVSSLNDVKLLSNYDFTAVTLFTRSSTINEGSDKLLNNTIFYEQ